MASSTLTQDALERLARFDTLPLLHGSHSPDSKFCVMEAVAYVAGEPWSDSPECVSPVIAAFLRSWNDSMPDAERTQKVYLTPEKKKPKGKVWVQMWD